MLPHRKTRKPPRNWLRSISAGSAFEQSLRSAQVITHPKGPAESVTFGATVTVHGPEGREVFKIVGVDEIDHEHGYISWLSPVARALMNAKVGQEVRFKYPCGDEQLEVISIAYD